MSLHPSIPQLGSASQKIVLHIIQIGVVRQTNTSVVFGRSGTAAVVMADRLLQMLPLIIPFQG